MDYKFLKKIISSLAANRPASEAAALALGIRPADILDSTGTPAPQVPVPSAIPNPTGLITPDEPEELILSAFQQHDDRGPDFQAHKAAFFFKLERELEKVCTAKALVAIDYMGLNDIGNPRSIHSTCGKKES